jgi:hypothetical protein
MHIQDFIGEAIEYDKKQIKDEYKGQYLYTKSTEREFYLDDDSFFYYTKNSD